MFACQANNIRSYALVQLRNNFTNKLSLERMTHSVTRLGLYDRNAGIHLYGKYHENRSTTIYVLTLHLAHFCDNKCARKYADVNYTLNDPIVIGEKQQ